MAISEISRNILIKIIPFGISMTDIPHLEALRQEKNSKATVFIDMSRPSLASGMKRTEEAIKDWIENNKKEIKIINTGSLGAYSLNPVIGIQIPGKPRIFFGPVYDYQVENLLEAVFSLQPPTDLLLGQWPRNALNSWEGLPYLEDHPFFKHQERRLLALHGIIDPDSFDDYLAWGGYSAFVDCLRNHKPEELIHKIAECEVRGRSGSGFPLIRKWKIAMDSMGIDIYLICNADESDPGGFMHRFLMEGNPHQVLEGIMITSYILSTHKAIIYTRNRYKETVSRLENAVRQIKNAGLLGQDILHSGFSLEIEIRKGPGAFVCGEETALIASIEGKRGMPNPKPPFPAEKGLYGQPTVVHNVETIAQIPLIINKGSKWYNSAGTKTSRGTKLLSLSGKFSNHGVIEVPMGISIKTIIEKIGLLPRNEKPAKALLMGGPSGLFIHPDEFKATLDFDDLQARKLALGSGSMLLLDNSNCVVEMTEYLMSFIQAESCGKCIPCREGTRQMADIIRIITHPNSGGNETENQERARSIEQLRKLATVIAETSLCGLGKNAPGSLISSIDKFKDDWERHLFDRVCDAGVCQDLRSFFIKPDFCTGCFLCLNKCPEMAIVGSPRQVHVIIEDKCTGCGICQEVCKFNAIEIR